jgi:hypothetical protein
LLIVERYFGVAAVVVSVGFKVFVPAFDHDSPLAVEFTCGHISIITDAESIQLVETEFVGGGDSKVCRGG